MPKPIALQLYTVRELTPTPVALRDVLRQVAEIGYAGVETGAIPGVTPVELRRWVAELGMVVCSFWAMPTAGNVNELVDIAGVLGVKQLVSCAGAERFETAAGALAVAETFEFAARLLQPHGLELCYHNHWWEFTKPDGERYAWDVLMAAAPSVRAELDIYWASNFGAVDVPTVVRRYANRTPLIHVKDGPLVKDQPNTAVGAGALDTLACLASYDPAVTQWLIVELDHCAGGDARMMDAVRDSYRYLTTAGFARGQRD